jgi:hypothetical protein
MDFIDLIVLIIYIAAIVYIIMFNSPGDQRPPIKKSINKITDGKKYNKKSRAGKHLVNLLKT